MFGLRGARGRSVALEKFDRRQDLDSAIESLGKMPEIAGDQRLGLAGRRGRQVDLVVGIVEAETDRRRLDRQRHDLEQVDQISMTGR